MHALLPVAALAAALAAVPAHADDRAGLRIEARASYETITYKSAATGSRRGALGSAVAPGVEAGYDLPLSPRLTAGPYLAIDGSMLEFCDQYGCIRGRGMAAGGIQLAWLRGERQVVYAKAGYARMALDVHARGRDLADSGGGLQLATGWELPLTGRVYVRLEAGYSGHGRIYHADFQRITSTLGVGMRF